MARMSEPPPPCVPHTNNAATMPGSSKDAHGLVPSLSYGTARKIIEMSAPIAIAMISLAFMVYGSRDTTGSTVVSQFEI